MDGIRLQDTLIAFVLGLILVILVLYPIYLSGYQLVILLIVLYGIRYKASTTRLLSLCFLCAFFYSIITGFFPDEYYKTASLLLFTFTGPCDLEPLFILIYIVEYLLHVLFGTLIIGPVLFLLSLPIFYFFLWILLRRNDSGREILKGRIKWTPSRDSLAIHSLCMGFLGCVFLLLIMISCEYLHPVLLLIPLLIPSIYFVYIKFKYNNLGKCTKFIKFDKSS